MHVCASPGASTGQRKALDPPGCELQAACSPPDVGPPGEEDVLCAA